MKQYITQLLKIVDSRDRASSIKLIIQHKKTQSNINDL